MIKCENEAILYAFSDKRDDWYQYLWGRMADCNFSEFINNQIAFVTFNYDRSLEQVLLSAAMNTYGVKGDLAIEALKQFEIIHLHGQLGDLHWQAKDETTKRNYDPQIDHQTLKIAAGGIQIIYEDIMVEKFKRVHKLIQDAQHIHLLGFGYHPMNLDRLQLAQAKCPVFGTAYGLSSLEISHICRESQLLPNERERRVLDTNNLRPVMIVPYFREHRELI